MKKLKIKRFIKILMIFLLVFCSIYFANFFEDFLQSKNMGYLDNDFKQLAEDDKEYIASNIKSTYNGFTNLKYSVTVNVKSRYCINDISLDGFDPNTVKKEYEDDTSKLVMNVTFSVVKGQNVTLNINCSNGDTLQQTIKYEDLNIIELTAKPGDFVDYDAGTWTQDEIDSLGTKYKESITDHDYEMFGGFSVGTSRNEYPNSTYKKGWRVYSIDTVKNEITLIQAGAAQDYFNPARFYGNANPLNNRDWSMYVNTKYANSARPMQYDDFCYMRANPASDMTTGTGCNYWMNTTYDSTRGGIYYSDINNWYGITYGGVKAIRMIVTLKPNIEFISGDGTANNPYKIAQELSFIGKPGDFVNYDAGTWTQDEVNSLGTLYSGYNDTNWTFSQFRAGSSRNASISDSKYSGWRILNIDQNTGIVNLISAGVPEQYNSEVRDHRGDHLYPDKVGGYRSQYILTGWHNPEDENNVDKSTTIRNWSMYVNEEYATAAHCLSLGEISGFTEDNDIRKIGVKYNTTTFTDMGAAIMFMQDIIDEDGKQQLLATSYNGIRMVVTLKANLKVLNGNGTSDDPFVLEPYLNQKAQIGDYIKYDAGTWTQDDINLLGDSYEGSNQPLVNGKFGGFTVGTSRNENLYSKDNSIYENWRVLTNKNGQVTLVSAGAPEVFHSDMGSATDSIRIFNSRNLSMYVNQFSTGARLMNYYDAYSIGNTISYSGDSLRNIGADYYVATPYDKNSSWLWGIGTDGRLTGYNYNPKNGLGLRVLVYMKDKVKIIAGSGTKDDPYILKI